MTRHGLILRQNGATAYTDPSAAWLIHNMMFMLFHITYNPKREKSPLSKTVVTYNTKPI